MLPASGPVLMAHPHPLLIWRLSSNLPPLSALCPDEESWCLLSTEARLWAEASSFGVLCTDFYLSYTIALRLLANPG